MFKIGDSKCRVLDAKPSAAGAARKFTGHVLAEWGITANTNDIALVVSELATNAVKATLPDGLSPLAQEGASDTKVIYLCLSLTGGAVRIQVWDNNPAAPVQAHPGDDAEGGRGLLLVSLLCKQWGTCWPPSGGKIVWAEYTIEAFPP
ncbi:ATP-binding protein [Thermopolyspora sp. NPDC052614]|uniref:ATP-binding protein n=1 Tax=Thermopolyspora sp. NPDC052614 TaxID=3155682 RepID=UPI00342D262E